LIVANRAFFFNERKPVFLQQSNQLAELHCDTPNLLYFPFGSNFNDAEFTQ
jgi:hypothetical protein